MPSPTDYLGHIVGAPGELSNTKQIYGYLRTLAEASPRVRVEKIGTTEEGRDIIVAIVSDEPGIDPIHRTLSRSDFRMVWNAILNWNDLPPPPSKPEEGAP